ncbi:MAG TPA: nodulation protein NfeD [Dehalococcoidia bacterium]|nr:nodulation protein NfeD [Dehalococcoidia bacterium]
MRKPRSRRRATKSVRLLVACLLLTAGVIALSCGNPVHKQRAVNVITVDGVINPVMARYVERGISNAENANAIALVIRVDTPGGLESSMRDMVQDIEAANVPVITYVSPSGARAASAGTFIVMAGNVAAMSPNTTIGAAHPIDIGGGDIEGTLGDKVTNEAAEYIKGIAILRGRNADWAEQTVRQSVAANQDEALSLNAIDLVANNLDDLLTKVDGRSVTLGSGAQTALATKDASVVNNGMTLIERFLLIISDPNIAFILLSLGSLGIFIELFHPGAFFPGVFGAIALLFGFFSLGTLPVNWAGVFLIVFAFVLFIAEVVVSGFGALGIGGVISLILGGLLLTSTSNPQFQVSRWLIFGLAAVVGLFVFTIITSIIRSRRLPAALGTYMLEGRHAVARTPLDPTGTVFVDGERWAATSTGERVERGETVEVTKVDGITLMVRPIGKEDESDTNGD